MEAKFFRINIAVHYFFEYNIYIYVSEIKSGIGNTRVSNSTTKENLLTIGLIFRLNK